MTSWWKLIAQRANHEAAAPGSWERRYAAGEGASDEAGHTWPGKQVRAEGATRDQGSWTKRLVAPESMIMGAAARSLYNQEGGIADDSGIIYEGLEDPPVVVVDPPVEEEPGVIITEITITGKVKPGYYGKFVYPVEPLQASFQYRVNFVADLSGLSANGALAGFGFGSKQGNRAHLTLLQGMGPAPTRGAIVRMSPPNGWNKPTGHSATDLGAPASGDQYGADLKLVTAGNGRTFNFYTSGDDQATWDEEAYQASFAPFFDAADAAEAGFAGYFHSSDSGEFTVVVRWRASAIADTTPPVLTNPAGGDA